MYDRSRLDSPNPYSAADSPASESPGKPTREEVVEAAVAQWRAKFGPLAERIAATSATDIAAERREELLKRRGEME
jgi:hypothetical protein